MIPSKLVYDGQGTIWLNDIDCSGSETKLLNCTHSIETSHCHHSEDVGVHYFLSCPAEEDEGLLRLMTCSAGNKGRLEINYKGEWGTICHNYFDHVDAAVACRQLGYCSGQMIHSKYVDGGQGTIWLDDVNCFGSEHKLINCTYSIDTSLCSHLNDVGLHCFLSCPAEEDEGRLHLISYSAANKGRLEINYKGEWGTICSTRFGHVDAAVACKQLGYCCPSEEDEGRFESSVQSNNIKMQMDTARKKENTEQFTQSTSGKTIPYQNVDDGKGTIWLDDINCSDSENKLINCTYSIDTSHCSHWYDVCIDCFLNCLTEDEVNSVLDYKQLLLIAVPTIGVLE
ncbi:unnamed protein product [Mytilus coruscus]|uniref:SRCR domain-containing protein n=1 Tax=Mytilus coruscus TaxID=42192 RepID=A0A6J8BWH0_MYTCO|nr:unnamed protein product [Mytilus coruscus]